MKRKLNVQIQAAAEVFRKPLRLPRDQASLAKKTAFCSPEPSITANWEEHPVLAPRSLATYRSLEHYITPKLFQALSSSFKLSRAHSSSPSVWQSRSAPLSPACGPRKVGSEGRPCSTRPSVRKTETCAVAVHRLEKSENKKICTGHTTAQLTCCAARLRLAGYVSG